MITRETISRQYIKGHGVEIGAFHNPFPLYGATIDYVDTKSREELRILFPEINFEATPVIDANIIDNGEILEKIKDETYDFLVSSHQLEHCMSPLTALENNLRVVKKGGHIFYAIPNKERTFDKERPTTTWEVFVDYLTRDIRNVRFKNITLMFPVLKEEWDQLVLNCYDEYFLNVDKIHNREERLRRGRESMENNNDIHFHTFTLDSAYEFFYRAKEEFKYQVVLFMDSGHEMFVVLKKL